MRSRCVLLLLVTAITCGCSTVSSKAPLGDPTSADEAKKLVGNWMTFDGDPFCVRHVKDNELRVASVSWNKEESQFELEEASAFLTQDEDRHYLNLAEPRSSETSSNESDADAESINYSFFRVTELSDRSMIIMFPEVDFFAKAVEDKVLAGSVEQSQNGKSVKLEATTEQLNEFVDPAKVGEQFDPELSFPLLRIQEASADE